MPHVNNTALCTIGFMTMWRWFDHHTERIFIRKAHKCLLGVCPQPGYICGPFKNYNLYPRHRRNPIVVQPIFLKKVIIKPIHSANHCLTTSSETVISWMWAQARAFSQMRRVLKSTILTWCGYLGGSYTLYGLLQYTVFSERFFHRWR